MADMGSTVLTGCTQTHVTRIVKTGNKEPSPHAAERRDRVALPLHHNTEGVTGQRNARQSVGRVSTVTRTPASGMPGVNTLHPRGP